MDKRKWIIPIVAVLFLALLPILLNQSYYFLHLATLSAIFVILAMALNLLLGYTGLVSIGHAGFFAIGAYASAILTATYGYPIWVGALAGIVVCVALGLVLGGISTKLHGGYLAVVTVGFGVIVKLVLINEVNVTGGGEGFLGIPPISLGGFAIVTPSNQYYFVTAVAVLIFLLTRNLVRSKVGRALVAVREQEVAANMMGINPARYKLLAFVLSAAVASIAGTLYAHYSGSLFPDYFSLPLSVTILISVVVGGMGTLIGPIIGGVVTTVGFELLRPLQEYQMIVYGIGVVLLLLFLPRGIAGIKGLSHLFTRIGNMFGNTKVKTSKEGR